jgi:hypothetical protein
MIGAVCAPQIIVRVSRIGTPLGNVCVGVCVCVCVFWYIYLCELKRAQAYVSVLCVLFEWMGGEGGGGNLHVSEPTSVIICIHMCVKMLCEGGVERNMHLRVST